MLLNFHDVPLTKTIKREDSSVIVKYVVHVLGITYHIALFEWFGVWHLSVSEIGRMPIESPLLTPTPLYNSQFMQFIEGLSRLATNKDSYEFFLNALADIKTELDERMKLARLADKLNENTQS